MCLSHAEEIEGICIVKPYALNLFRNGDLLGPALLLKFQRGAINDKQLEAFWRTESKKVRRPTDWNWNSQMPLYCRGCSESAGAEVYKAASGFTTKKDSVWRRIISFGMESFCTHRSTTRTARAGAAGGARVE